ncbi:MAG: hypothetical protein CMC08_05565 [Flavobacteriaceae bacterium]|nr:hypothetical protein [Flavobacteriaceae bacterium]
MKNINKELVSLLLIVISGLLIFSLAVGVAYLFIRFIELPHSGWYLILYTTLCVASVALLRWQQSHFTRTLQKAILFPVRALLKFITIGSPYIVLQIHFLLYVVISGLIPLAFFTFDYFSPLLDLTTATHIYINVTLCVITATLLNKQVTRITYYCSPIRLMSSQKLKKVEIKRLTDYLLSENNIKFIIYLLYFVYLLIVNLFNFQQNSFYSSPELDKAVLQSFITFIALERLISNLKDLDFKPSEMVRKLLTAMTNPPAGDKTQLPKA